ncbi:phage portal protein [Alsobacter sp. R-9]
MTPSRRRADLVCLLMFGFGRRKKIEEKASSGIAIPEPWLSELFGAVPTLSGASVTPESAMRVPAVKASVELISSTVGTLPAKVFRRFPEGGKEAATDHPAYALVHDDANDWTSAHALRTQLTIDALLRGNGFAYANRVNGRIVELVRLTGVEILVDDVTGEPAYRVDGRIYQRTEILHIAAPVSFDGITGVSPVTLAREAIALALVLEQHAANLFGRGARPSGILRFQKALPAEVAARIRDAWHTAHGGSNSGKTAVLEEGAEFQQIAFNSVDAQFAEMRTFQTLEIARAFRVPPHMLFELGRATWSNSEQQNREFLQTTLLPWLRAWEAAYRRLLLTPEDRAEHSIEFVVDDLLRADTASRATAYAALRQAGVMTANEIRALENLPAHPDGDMLDNPAIATTSNQETP